MFGFMLFSRFKIKSYLASLEQYQKLITTVQGSIETQGSTQVQNLLTMIGPIANKAFIFMFIIVPLAIIIAWIVFEGINYCLMSRKGFSWKALLRLGILTLPLMIVLALIIIELINLFNNYTSGLVSGWWLIVLGLIALIIGYLLHMLFATFNEGKVKKVITRTLSLALKQMYAFLPLILVYFIIGLLVFGGWLGLWIGFIAKQFSWISLIIMIISLLICIWYRTFLVVYIQKIFRF